MEFIGRKPEDLRRAAIDLHRQNTGGEPSSRAHLLIDSAMGALCSEKSGRRNLHQKLQLRANGGITGLSSIEEMASNLLVRFRNPQSYHLSHAFTSGAIEDMVFTKRNNLAVSCIASTDAGRANNLLHLNWHDVDDGTSTIGQILSRPVALNSGGHRVKSRSPQSDYEYCTVSNVRVWDDRIMVSGGFDKKLKVWSMVDGCVVGSVDCHNGNIIRVDQHLAVPNLFVSASADGTGCILRVSEDGVVNSSHKRITRKRPLTGAQFGKQYSDGFVYFCTEAIENMEARVTVCDYRTFKVFQHFECDYNIGSMDISSNGKLLAYGTFPQSNNPHISVCSTNIMPQWGDRMIHLLDLQMGRECCRFFCDQQDVNVVSFSPCGTYIASAGIENHTTIFDVRLASKPLHILHHNSDNQEINRDGIADIKWLSSDVIATASSEEPVVRFWDIRLASGTHLPADVNKRATGAINLIHSVEAPGGPVSRIAVSNDQSYFAIGTQMGSVALYSCSARDHYRLSTFPQEVQSI
ncbi:WD40-repeat-containing domain protein [Paraphysoderma sedebokerense]|nr:WD40-repeat-containing domain protein [Paraphysoderma sedebokerense]